MQSDSHISYYARRVPAAIAATAATLLLGIILGLSAKAIGIAPTPLNTTIVSVFVLAGGSAVYKAVLNRQSAR